MLSIVIVYMYHIHIYIYMYITYQVYFPIKRAKNVQKKLCHLWGPDDPT